MAVIQSCGGNGGTDRFFRRRCLKNESETHYYRAPILPTNWSLRVLKRPWGYLCFFLLGQPLSRGAIATVNLTRWNQTARVIKPVYGPALELLLELLLLFLISSIMIYHLLLHFTNFTGGHFTSLLVRALTSLPLYWGLLPWGDLPHSHTYVWSTHIGSSMPHDVQHGLFQCVTPLQANFSGWRIRRLTFPKQQWFNKDLES